MAQTKGDLALLGILEEEDKDQEDKENCGDHANRPRAPFEHKFSFGASMPRLRFEDVLEMQNSSRMRGIREQTSFQKKEHAIDSDGMLAVAYHTRRLILRGFNGLLYSRLSHKHKRFLTKLAGAHYRKRTQISVLKGVKTHASLSRKKRTLRLLQDTLILRRRASYLKLWRAATKQAVAETAILKEFANARGLKNSRKILAAWRGQARANRRLRNLRNKLLARRGRALLVKGFSGLRSVARQAAIERKNDVKARKLRRNRLLRKGMKWLWKSTIYRKRQKKSLVLAGLEWSRAERDKCRVRGLRGLR